MVQLFTILRTSHQWYQTLLRLFTIIFYFRIFRISLLRKEKSISTLDLIFTDSDSLIDYIELRPPLAALENGHLCIDFGIGIGEKNQATNYISGRKLAYQRAECHKIESELLELDWTKLLFGDANKNYEIFLNILNGIVRNYFYIFCLFLHSCWI